MGDAPMMVTVKSAKQTEEQKRRAKTARKHFKGKTIKKVDTSAINFWIFTFTDGTKAYIEASVWIGIGVMNMTDINGEEL